MRAAARSKANNDLQFELFTFTSRGYEAAQPAGTGGGEAPAQSPPENADLTRSPSRDAASSGESDGQAPGIDSRPTESPLVGSTVGGPADLGDDLEEIRLPPVGELTRDAEPEPLRNRNNFRITDDDKIGVGSLKAKCRANLSAIEV